MTAKDFDTMTAALAQKRFDEKIRDIKRSLAEAMYKAFPSRFHCCARGAFNRRDPDFVPLLNGLAGLSWPQEWLETEIDEVRREMLATMDIVQKAKIAAESYVPEQSFEAPKEQADAKA
jgi:hypothetical protein